MPTTQIRVPYIDLARQHRALKPELLDAVSGVLDHGQFILGDEVRQFEERFAALTGTAYAVGVNSGTDALVLALRALEIGAGDEVITAPNSFVASASAIALVGARPVFADVGPDLNLDPARVEEALTSRTKALLPVHLTGRPADMDALRDLARRRGLKIVEDCAQAVLAEHRGRRVGSLGDAGCFSLHPLKTLNACGDGGVVTTSDRAVYERLTLLRNIGLRSREDCAEWSGNSRLDTLQAALLLVKLRYVEAWTEARRRNARFYRERLSGLDSLRVPDEPAELRSAYHTFVIEAERRDALKAFLANRGIETAVHYPVPIHLQSAARDLGYGPGSFPRAESQAARILSLPMMPELTESELSYVTDSIREFYR